MMNALCYQPLLLFVTSELSYGYPKTLIWKFLKCARRRSLVLENSIAYGQLVPLCTPGITITSSASTSTESAQTHACIAHKFQTHADTMYL